MGDNALRTVDVAIVGGGPAGLTAAIYLGRFLRSCLVFDSGDARARLIPVTHNFPGFPDGIGGEALLGRLSQQAIRYGSQILQTHVSSIRQQDGRFVLTTGSGEVTASKVILATGIVDKAPDIPHIREAIARGAVRICPICDAYEVRGQRIGVVGGPHMALKEALFLKHYSEDVVLLFSYPDDVPAEIRREADLAGIRILDTVDDLVLQEDRYAVVMADGSFSGEIDALYPAMGCDIRSELATALGAECESAGFIVTGEHSETSIPGLYAAGDVAKGLNQMATGCGHAAAAATHIHNSLPRAHGMRPPVQS